MNSQSKAVESSADKARKFRTPNQADFAEATSDMHWVTHKLESLAWREGGRWMTPDEHAELIRVLTDCRLVFTGDRR